jgi:hypothetical protein
MACSLLHMLSELGDAWMHEAGVVLIAHLHRLPVRTRVEDDLCVLGQRRIDNGVKID